MHNNKYTIAEQKELKLKQDLILKIRKNVYLDEKDLNILEISKLNTEELKTLFPCASFIDNFLNNCVNLLDPKNQNYDLDDSKEASDKMECIIADAIYIIHLTRNLTFVEDRRLLTNIINLLKNGSDCLLIESLRLIDEEKIRNSFDTAGMELTESDLKDIEDLNMLNEEGIQYIIDVATSILSEIEQTEDLAISDDESFNSEEESEDLVSEDEVEALSPQTSPTLKEKSINYNKRPLEEKPQVSNKRIDLGAQSLQSIQNSKLTPPTLRYDLSSSEQFKDSKLTPPQDGSPLLPQYKGKSGMEK